MQIYVSGIHTNVGKTHVSAAFCYGFNYAYFKLIQAGIPRDCEIVSSFDSKIEILGDGVFLKTAASPHIGKLQENLHYMGLDIVIPARDKVVIELAGGLFSPIDEHNCMLDYMRIYKLPTILVGSYYLGAINHIILSINALKQSNIDIICIVMNGIIDSNIDKFIYDYTGISIIHLNTFDNNNFIKQALKFKQNIESCFIYKNYQI